MVLVKYLWSAKPCNQNVGGKNTATLPTLDGDSNHHCWVVSAPHTHHVLIQKHLELSRTLSAFSAKPQKSLAVKYGDFTMA